MTTNMWQPAPLLLAHPTLFTPREIDAFEKQLLCNSHANEHDASEFFVRYPKFLYLGQGKEVRREVVLHGTDGRTTRRVDFFRKSYGTAFWDIVELKDPQKPTTVAGSGLHLRLSAFFKAAVDQAEDYRDLLIADADLRTRLLRDGIAICRPQIVVIAGKNDPNVAPETLQVLYDRLRRSPVEPRSYTDVYQFAKQHCAKNTVLVTGGYAIGDEAIGLIRPAVDGRIRRMERVSLEGPRIHDSESPYVELSNDESVRLKCDVRDLSHDLCGICFVVPREALGTDDRDVILSDLSNCVLSMPFGNSGADRITLSLQPVWWRLSNEGVVVGAQTSHLDGSVEVFSKYIYQRFSSHLCVSSREALHSR